jgi:hypothetical protein
VRGTPNEPSETPLLSSRNDPQPARNCLVSSGLASALSSSLLLQLSHHVCSHPGLKGSSPAGVFLTYLCPMTPFA